MIDPSDNMSHKIYDRHYNERDIPAPNPLKNRA
jgi:hypothetical protein